MPISRKDFMDQFQSVINSRDEIVVVYSGIWTFGHRFGTSAAEIPEILINSMLEVLGPDCNLVLPAYTYSYTKFRRYSPKDTLPETGVLPSSLLQDKRFLRTRSALNSFFVYGPRANELANIQGPSVWGEGSFKHFLEANHARIIVLGLSWKDACGYLHRIEEANLVPYRYHKTFNGFIENTTGSIPWKETMYVRSLEVMPVFRWQLVDDMLKTRGLIKKNPGEIFIESANAKDISLVGSELLFGNKYALLDNVSEVKNWVENKRLSEIQNLRNVEPEALEYFDNI